MAKTRVYHLANMAEVESDPGRLALLFGELAACKEPMGKRALANALAVNVNCSPSQLLACCEAGAFRVVFKNPLVPLYVLEGGEAAKGILYFLLREELRDWCFENQEKLTLFDFWPADALTTIVGVLNHRKQRMRSLEIYKCLDLVSWVRVRTPDDYGARWANLDQVKRQIGPLSRPRIVQESIGVEA